MSYEKLVDGCRTKEENDAHEKKWGKYNDPLPNMKEITAEEFAQSGFFTWSITGMEFRQIDPKQFKEGSLLSPVTAFMHCKIFFTNSSHESGFAMTGDYWTKKVRYFKFADCFHDWKEISAKDAGKPVFNCYHYCRCSKCGASWEYDSSG